MKDIWLNDWVLWDEQVYSDQIVPDAHDIHPAKRGDLYSYQVEHIGRVTQVNTDGSIKIRDQQGKQYTILTNDPHLRKVSWFRRKWKTIKK